jgi:hypothetical protein
MDDVDDDYGRKTMDRQTYDVDEKAKKKKKWKLGYEEAGKTRYQTQKEG